jgi:hypothetical protein
MTDETTAVAAEPEDKGNREAITHWLSEIDAARDREDEFRKDGAKLREMYAGEKKATTPFNIVFSNTETIAPALYSATPRPVVSRRYKDDDQVGKLAATAGQRMLEFLLDTNLNEYETFDGAVKSAVNDSLLPGRGVTTAKYDAEIYDEKVASELACLSSEKWDRVCFGYATKWVNVPWVAFEMYYTKASAKKDFGPAVANALQYSEDEDRDEGGKKGGKEKKGKKDKGSAKLACVYQIWDKQGGRKVRYVSSSYPDAYLKVDADPLELSGFYNCPRPLEFIEKSADLTPTAPYSLYQTQAEELNDLTRRIIRITKAIKARGLYDSTLGTDFDNLMSGDDNELLPTESAATLAGGDINKAIWFMPLEQLIVTLKELIVARESCKQTIYEIMGIADILRGASDAGETLGAQQIKTRWGSLRLKPKQGEVQRYVRDLLRLLLEIAANKFSQESWAKMTGLPYLTDMQVEQGMAVAQAAASQGQNEPLQQLQAAPKWADVLKVLKDDLTRAFKIDIETNSTIEPEAMEDQQSITQLMDALGGFMKGVGPLVVQGVMPFEAAQAMLLAITRRFRFGDTIEDMIKQMKPPKPVDDGAKEEAAAKEQAAQQQMIQAQQDAMKKDAEIQQLKTEVKQLTAEKQLGAEKSAVALERIDLDTEKKLFEIEKRAAENEHTNKVKTESQGLDHKRQLNGLTEKVAKQSQGSAEKAGTKYDAALATVVQSIEQLTKLNGHQAETFAALTKAIGAPRKRTAVYGKDGRIESSTEEVVQ